MFNIRSIGTERMNYLEMDRVRKRADILGRVKWLGLFAGLVMYYATVKSFGDTISMVLACAAAVAFYYIFENERRSVISRCISEHLDAVLNKIGQRDSVFEIRNTGRHMIIRIYLIKARERAPLCSKAAMDAITKSWYRSKVWITQIVDLESHEEIPEAQKALDDELFEDLKNK